jgi:hypothetical protein
MKKILSFVIAILFCTLLFAGCKKISSQYTNVESPIPSPETDLSENGESPYTVNVDTSVYFENIAELNEAFAAGTFNKTEEIAGALGYFAPANINDLPNPRDISAQNTGWVFFEWDTEEVQFPYGQRDFELTFEWMGGKETGDLQQYLRDAGSPERYEWKGDYLVYTVDEQRLWVIWEEQGYEFRSVVPSAWSWEQITDFCTVQWVEVTPQG